MTLIKGKVPVEVDWMKLRDWFAARGYTYPQLPYIYQNAGNEFKVRWDWALFLSMMLTKNFKLLKNRDLGMTGKSYLSLHEAAKDHLLSLEKASEQMKTFEAYCVELGYNFEELKGYREDFEVCLKLGHDYDLPYPPPPPPPQPPAPKQPKPDPQKPTKPSEPPKVEPPKKPSEPVDWMKLALYIIGPILLMLKCGK